MTIKGVRYVDLTHNNYVIDTKHIAKKHFDLEQFFLRAIYDTLGQ